MPPLLAIDECGAGERLVLIHGLATDRRIWDLVVPEISTRRRVITVDMPGFGASSPVAAGFDLEQVADRIARGLAAQGVRGPFDLVGHSLGGAVAATIAARRPRTVRRLVLAAPAGLLTFPATISNLLAAGADGALAIRRRAAGLTRYAWGRRMLLALTAADGAALTRETAEQLLAASATAQRTAAALRAVAVTDLRPVLASVAAPLGVIWGEADLTVPISALDALLAVRADAEVVRLPAAGHVPMAEFPELFTAALERLLRGLHPLERGFRRIIP